MPNHSPFLSLAITALVVLYTSDYRALAYSINPTTKKDIEQKVDSLCKIHNKYIYKDVKKAIAICERSLSLADSIGYDLGRITSKKDLGYCYLLSGDFELSLKFGFDALNDLKIVLAENNFDERPQIYDSKLSEIYCAIGGTYNHLDYFPLSLKYFNKAEKIFLQQNRRSSLAKLYVNKASIYRRNNEVKYAKDMLGKAIEIFKELGQMQYMSACHTNMCNIYFSLKEYDTAKIYLDSAILVSRETKDYNILSTSFNNKANILYDEQKYEAALANLDSASVYLAITPMKKYISNNNMIRGGVYLKLNQIDVAEKILVDELQNAIDLLFNRNAEQICETLIELYEKKNEPEKILKYKSILLDLKTNKEQHQDNKAIIEEKYARQFDEQADLFDFKESLYKKSNGVIIFILAFLAIQVIIFIILFSRRKSLNLN